MKRNVQRFAPLGLYLSLLAAIVSAGLYIVYRAWNLPLQISLALIVVGLALFAILDPGRVRQALTGRQARYGSNTLIMSIAFVGILVVVNYVVYQNPQRWDMTEDKQFTLAKETLETLQKLPQPVEAQAFFTPRMSRTTAQGLLDQYKFHAKGKFDYEFINPLEDPGLAQAANITTDGSIVLRMGDRRETVTFASEDGITGALVRMMGEKVTVYFLTGHGEYSPEDSGDQSLGQLKRALEDKNYTIKPLNLLVDKKIPEDARVVVIAGPVKPLTEEEINTLSVYMNSGGSLVVMEESPIATEMGDVPDPLADYLAQAWGITLGNDVVVDLTSQNRFATIPYQYGQHEITESVQRFGSAFPTARSMTTRAIEGVTLTDLAKTAPYPATYAETDLAALIQDRQSSPDEEKDVLGPITLAVAGENFGSQGRLVVFGDRDFAIDVNFSFLGNGDLAINSIDWAAKQENLINLSPKDTTTRLMVPPTQVTLGLILLGSVFVLPGMVLVLGIIVWIQRRRRG